MTMMKMVTTTRRHSPTAVAASWLFLVHVVIVVVLPILRIPTTVDSFVISRSSSLDYPTCTCHSNIANSNDHNNRMILRATSETSSTSIEGHNNIWKKSVEILITHSKIVEKKLPGRVMLKWDSHQMVDQCD